jgi:soluble lytic murein transglycosylase-like protein
MIRYAVAGFGLMMLAQPAVAQTTTREALDALIAQHAAANGVPVALVHRVIVRESRYNPRVIGRGGTMGLMQIKHATARGVGYTGSPAGLLDPNTNLTYAVRYLAGAYRAANGNADRAVAYYASGYYYAAKRQQRAGTATAQTSPPAVAAALAGVSSVPSMSSLAHTSGIVEAQPTMDTVD